MEEANPATLASGAERTLKWQHMAPQMLSLKANAFEASLPCRGRQSSKKVLPAPSCLSLKVTSPRDRNFVLETGILILKSKLKEKKNKIYSKK